MAELLRIGELAAQALLDEALACGCNSLTGCQRHGPHRHDPLA